MKIKIMYLALMLTLTATMAMAQSTTSFAVLGGVNFQNLNGKDNLGKKLENDMIIGYHAGVNAQIPIASEFYFQPGLLFSTKGAKNTELGITSTYNLSYVELPLNLVYKGALGSGYVMVGFGPYIGYGVLGKATFEGGGITVKSDVVFRNTLEPGDPFGTTYFKALDAGGNIFAGYETAGGLFFQLNTQLGMLKINPKDNRIPEGQTAVKNTGFGLSVGYRF